MCAFKAHENSIMQPTAIIERLFTLLLYILRGTQTYSIRSTAIITVIHAETCGENIPKKSTGLQIQSCSDNILISKKHTQFPTPTE
jgi:hypothetical protein